MANATQTTGNVPSGGDETAFRKYFRRDLHDGLVRNLRKVGLLTERITPSLQSFGIKLAA